MEVTGAVMPKMFGPVWSDLGEVHKTTEVLNRFPDADKRKGFSLLELSPLEANLRPAVVLLVGRMFGAGRERLIALAAIVQLVFLGMRVHGQIGEDGAGPDDRNRLAVLIGDYYYGRFFALAATTGMTEFVRPLTEIVRRLNEGTMTRLHLSPTTAVVRESIRQETAALLAEACRMAGQVAGAGEDEQLVLYRLGHDLGMGYGLMERELRTEALVSLRVARARLADLPDGVERDALDALVAYLLDWPGQSVADVQS